MGELYVSIAIASTCLPTLRSQKSVRTARSLIQQRVEGEAIGELFN